MKIKEQHNKLNEMLMEFHFNKDFEITTANNNAAISKKKFKKLSQEINSLNSNSLHLVFDGCEVRWNKSNKIQGCINISSLSDIITDQWQDMVTEVNGAEQNLEKFRVFDLFENQEYVGLFLDTYEKTGLYYVRELDGYPIHLTMESYFILAVETMGLLHWQELIISWEYNKRFSSYKNMLEKLNEIPNFDISKFKELYYQLKTQ